MPGFGEGAIAFASLIWDYDSLQRPHIATVRNVRTNRADNKTDGRIADNITGGGNEQNEKDFVHTHTPCYSCELKRLTTIPQFGKTARLLSFVCP